MAQLIGILKMELKDAVILNSGTLIWHNENASVGYLNLKLECNQYMYAILGLMYLEINKTS